MLHRLTHVTIGVPDVAANVAYYAEFGLAHDGAGRFTSRDGGEQLRLVTAPTRRLVEVGIGADHPDDLARAAASLQRLGVPTSYDGAALVAEDPVSRVRATLSVAPRVEQRPAEPTPYNGPGRVERHGRAPGILREGPVRPRKLGHVVIGSVDHEATMRFFVDGLGFRTSDYIKGHGAFMRCSEDHHNVLVLASPVNYLHHTSWQVDDIDEVGRGASAMLEGDPGRHVWGLGRHHAGSNFFWYLKDPAGNFSEYYSDMDTIAFDELWTPEVLEGAKGLFNWGPPPPPSFLAPDDLGALMTGAHSAS